MSLSQHAVRAMENLRESWFINWIVRGSIHDPPMGGSDHHPNWRIFGAMERYLSVQQVCHAADTLNSYCELILADILETNPATWSAVSPYFRRNDLQKTIDRLRAHRQFGAREALRDGINPFWSPESDVVVTLRNKLVHQGGLDGDRELEQLIASKNGQWCIVPPPDLIPSVVPIAYSGDELVVDAHTGLWACRHVQNHIHLMDQNLTHRFSLTTLRYRPRALSFGVNSNRSSLPLPPGTPLPTSSPPERDITTPPTPSINPDYSMLIEQREIDCAQLRLRIRSDLDSMIRTYCDQADLEIIEIAGSMPGSILSHTIRGHDLNLIYKLQPKHGGGTSSEQVEVRIREVDFNAFLTVFGTKSQMRDFKLPSDLEIGIEYLRSCIDRALQT